MNLHLFLYLGFDLLKLKRIIAAAQVNLTKDILEDFTGSLLVLLVQLFI